MKDYIDFRGQMTKVLGKAKMFFVPKALTDWLARYNYVDFYNKLYNEQLQGDDYVENMRISMNYMNQTLEVIGRENLPSADSGQKFTFVCNHPMGLPDSIAFSRAIGEIYDGKINIFATVLTCELPGLSDVVVPVKVTGEHDREELQLHKKIFATDNQMLLHPSGRISEIGKDGYIHDLPWKTNFLRRSIQSHRDVVPVFCDGMFSRWFYQSCHRADFFMVRKHIFDVFIMYHEMKKHMGEHFKVYIGKPIPWQTFDQSRKLEEWAQYVRQKCYELAPQQKPQ
jgi:1-acyl-sn-glycerol-3-phosphate acyltransferase